MPAAQTTESLPSPLPRYLKFYDEQNLIAEGLVFWREPQKDQPPATSPTAPNLSVSENLEASAFSSSPDWLPVVQAIEARIIRRVLEDTDGDVEQAASALGMTARTLNERIKSLDIN